MPQPSNPTREEPSMKITMSSMITILFVTLKNNMKNFMLGKIQRSSSMNSEEVYKLKSAKTYQKLTKKIFLVQPSTSNPTKEI